MNSKCCTCAKAAISLFDSLWLDVVQLVEGNCVLKVLDELISGCMGSTAH